MIKEAPIPYRNGDYTVVCAKCGHEQLELQTPTSFEYFEKKEYLDGFRRGMEIDYFELMFQKCEKCDNFAPDLHMDWTKSFMNAKIMKILNSDKPELEKRFLIAHEIEPSHQSLLDLYWYYDLNKPEEADDYRDALIKQFKKAFEEDQSRYALRMYVELLRRKGDFRKAIKLAQKDKFLPNNAINESLEFSSPYESDMIEMEIALCKAKNSEKQVFSAE
jgi:hypothetical protein